MNINLNINQFIGFMILGGITIAAFAPLTLSVLPQLAGIIGCGILLFKRIKLSLPSKSLIIALAAIITLSLLSTLWSVNMDKTLSRAVKVAGQLVSFIPLFILLRHISVDIVNIVKKYFSYPVIIAGILIAIELIFNFPLTYFIIGNGQNFETWQLNKNVAVMALLMPLAIYFTVQNKQFILTFIIALIAVLIGVFTASQAAQLAIIVMLLAAISVYFMPRVTVIMGFVGSGLLLFLMPFVSPIAYNDLAGLIGEDNILRQACTSTRLESWSAISQTVMQNPYLGYGMDATRSLTFNSKMLYHTQMTIMHPHNIGLQLWVEFGVVGMLLAWLLLCIIYKNIRIMARDQQIISFAVFCGAMIFLMVSWSIWSGWLIGLILFSAFLCLLNKRVV